MVIGVVVVMVGGDDDSNNCGDDGGYDMHYSIIILYNYSSFDDR
jgi:hypothetical protein